MDKTTASRALAARCDDVITFRIPSALRKAINLAAERDYRSESSYVRLIERLHRDGIPLDISSVSP
jgi:hypothetical protein